MLNARDALRAFDQRHEGAALQIHQRVLVQGLGNIGIAAAHHLGQGGGDDGIVVADFAELAKSVHGHLQCHARRGARQGRFGRYWRRVIRGQSKQPRLGVSQHPIAIHGDAVVVAQKAQPAGIGGGSRHRRHADGFEDLTDHRHGTAGAAFVVPPAQQQLFASTPAGNQADAHFHQTHVSLGMGLNGIAMQQHFAASAERHARGRAQHRKGRVLERLECLLSGAHRGLDIIPGGGVGGEHHQTEIRAHGEVRRLVVDHQSLERAGNNLQCLADHGHDIRIDGIHLRVKLQTCNAVAHIPEARRAVGGQRLRAELDIGQQLHPFGPYDVVIGAVGAEELAPPVGNTVKAPRADTLQQFRHRPAFVTQPRGEPVGAQAIDELEGSVAPVVTELHGLIHRDHVVCDLGHQRCRIGQCFRHDPPGIGAALVRVFHERTRAAAARRRDALELHFSGIAVLTAAEIDGLLDAPSAVALQAIKAALAFAPGVAVGDHLLDQIRHVEVLAHGVVGVEQRIHADHDVRHQIDAHQIHQTEHAGLRDPQRPARHRVGLLHGQSLRHGFEHRALQPVDADSVADEARCVFALHHALAQRPIAELPHLARGITAGCRARHQLQQAHVARRIEKVRDEKIAPETIRHFFEQTGQRNGGRIG